MKSTFGLITRITPACADAQVFFTFSLSVTVTDNLHNSLHLGSFLCVFALAYLAADDHNQDPRGIDW
ncbi:hypothetical protein E6R41_20650 [Citrobacter freundii]|nr:hypothetical protein C3K52_09300 [Citrobacter freundii]QAR63985.1 hypothetical protein C3B53_04875 [Citrobacter sp. SL156]QBK97664.1 hypothetical protein E1A41_04640 [Citrobacter freundii]RVR35625.1 hypothetical protein EOL29_00935 [Citrobacter freundii]RVR70458.1 hypothetical protein EOL30_04065 [Citrobacter freundii]